MTTPQKTSIKDLQVGDQINYCDRVCTVTAKERATQSTWKVSVSDTTTGLHYHTFTPGNASRFDVVGNS